MRSVTTLAASLRDGTTTATALAEQFIAREAASRERLHSFVAVDASRLLADASVADDELTSGTDRGPLHGVPVGVKDIVDVEGYPTRWGSPLSRRTPADHDATVVARLRHAGALIAGKTASHELACGVVTAPTSNPWDLDRVPGGSSGGSGAAVGAGLVTIALGSDTGGSIRIPAALCGVVGLKPTYGLVPVDGVLPLSTSLDHVGPLGATVADCAHAMTALAADGLDYAAALDRGIDGLRLGVVTHEPFAPMQHDVERAVHAGVDTLRSLGAICVEIIIPELRHCLAAEFGIIPLEAYQYHERSLRLRPLDIDPDIRMLLTAGAVLPLSVYRRALAARSAISRTIDDAMAQHRLDALVTPTLPATAAAKSQTEHTYGDMSEPITNSYVRTTAPFNLSGQPAISVPCGFDDLGLPIGLQITTHRGADALALRVAHALDATAPSDREPPRF